MRHAAGLIVGLAVALLETGCAVSVHNDSCATPGTMTFGWTFDDSVASGPGNTGLSCFDAGVSDVRVIVDGVEAETYACSEGDMNGNPGSYVALDNIVSTDYEFIVEGLDSGGGVLYRSINTVPGVCGELVDFDVVPSRGTLYVDYALSGAPYPGDYIWYQISDQTFVPAELVALVDENHAPSSIPSNSTGSIFVADVPFGTYQLDWIESVDADSAVVDEACPGPTVNVTSTDANDLLVNLYAPPAGLAVCH